MISLKRLSLFTFAIVLISICAAPYATAQQPPLAIKPLRPSQKASVMQTVGVTDITITYSRPPVKGRTIFADAPASMEARAKGEATLDNQNERKPGEPIVPYNHLWRAGANEATMFQVTDDVLINGQFIEKLLKAKNILMQIFDLMRHVIGLFFVRTAVLPSQIGVRRGRKSGHGGGCADLCRQGLLIRGGSL